MEEPKDSRRRAKSCPCASRYGYGIWDMGDGMDMGQRSPELGICPRPSEHATMDSHTPGIKITPLADGISMAILTLDTIEIQALMTVRGKSGSDKYVLSKRHFALIEGGGAPHQIRFQLFARRREDQPR